MKVIATRQSNPLYMATYSHCIGFGYLISQADLSTVVFTSLWKLVAVLSGRPLIATVNVRSSTRSDRVACCVSVAHR